MLIWGLNVHSVLYAIGTFKNPLEEEEQFRQLVALLLIPKADKYVFNLFSLSFSLCLTHKHSLTSPLLGTKSLEQLANREHKLV